MPYQIDKVKKDGTVGQKENKKIKMKSKAVNTLPDDVKPKQP